MSAPVRSGIVVLVATLLACPAACEAPLGGQQWSETIVADDVDMSNVDRFEQQLRNDLPIGTPKHEVEAYLRRIGVGFTFVPGMSRDEEFRFSPLHTHFLSGIDNIGTAFIDTVPFPVPVRLDILIFLSDEETVERVETAQFFMIF